jgi:hypothetical protein
VAGLACASRKIITSTISYNTVEVLTVVSKKITVFWMWRRTAVLRSLPTYRSNLLPPSSGDTKFETAMSAKQHCITPQKTLNFLLSHTSLPENLNMDRDTAVYLSTRTHSSCMFLLYFVPPSLLRSCNGQREVVLLQWRVNLEGYINTSGTTSEDNMPMFTGTHITTDIILQVEETASIYGQWL